MLASITLFVAVRCCLKSNRSSLGVRKSAGVERTAAIHVSSLSIGQRGGLRIQNLPVHHPAQYQLVIACSSTSLQRAFEIRQRVFQNGRARLPGTDTDSRQLVPIAT